MPYNTVISFPIPAYQNLPIHPEYYQPNRFVISGVTRGQTTIITTTIDLNYVIGQLVRLIIPQSFGCRQLNQQLGYVLSLPSSNQVELSIDSSRNVDPYVASTAKTTAQIIAVGDNNSGAINGNGGQNYGTFIPGSFIDISPL